MIIWNDPVLLLKGSYMFFHALTFPRKLYENKATKHSV